MPRPILRLALHCFVIAATGVAAGAAETVDFQTQIRPLLSNHCFACHGPDEEERAAGLRLDTQTGATDDLGGYAAVVAGDPEASELLLRLTTEDEDLRMPPAGKGPRLKDDEIELIRRWIEQGAPYANHWAYTPVRKPEIPATQNPAWARNPIDRFVLARLEASGLKPNDEADRWTLARRLSLDLTGLPPTWEEASAFARDPRPRAYELYVESLLAKPTFGERWGRVWLDLARYADSAGYADDPPRTIWLYRDYVIDSLNANKPFDQFTIEQIAGDLLEDPSPDQLIATAFHRNTMTNNEGGTNDEEFRNVAVVDRVNTTMAVWMGTTMACAQCHTHKYDPITLEEYFQFFAFFNNTADADKRDEQPLFELWTDQQKARRDRVAEELSKLREMPEPPKEKIEELTKTLASIKPSTTVPIMQELAQDRRRVTKVQLRGNYQSTAQDVDPGTPAVFPPLPPEAPRDRLTLARWLVDDKNPLTPRVIANRHWEELFGTGIVETSEEFGSQGELPSHPQLLDWLAAELVESGWDLKQLVRLIVLSSTYRQDSVTNAQEMEDDPANRMLARGPRVRASAEMIRDQALFVSGLLSHKIGGPSVNPPQPELGLKAAFGSATDWKTSDGADRYRRGLYTSWRRSNPYPSMSTFDAPNREVCQLRRSRTNTPLQALVTLNDPVYVEAARALASEMIASGTTVSERARNGFHRTLIREPSPQELERLVELFTQTQASFAAEPEQATALIGDSSGSSATAVADVVERAAWTLVANVLLNLDELLMKR